MARKDRPSQRVRVFSNGERLVPAGVVRGRRVPVLTRTRRARNSLVGPLKRVERPRKNRGRVM